MGVERVAFRRGQPLDRPLQAQLALALDGADRENILAQLVELLALRPSPRREGK